MANVHWFDTLNKVLVRESPRRTLLGMAAVLAGLARNAPLTEAGKKKKQNQNQKKTKKRKKNPAPPPSPPPTPPPPPPPPGTPPDLETCLGANPPHISRESWEEYCRNQHGQCPGNLCTVLFEHPDAQPQALCCAPPKTCCDNGCYDTQSDIDACDGCYKRCTHGAACVAGQCKFLPCSSHFDCPPGVPCVNGTCTCGTYNYCRHSIGGPVCSSGDCNLIT